MIVDAHHHFWDPTRADYPWLTDDLAVIRRPFGVDHLRPLIETTGIDATVLVQTRSSREETREFLATAASTPFIRGVVGWVDLTDERVGDALAELGSAPGGDRLVGIRHQVHDEPDPDWLLRPDVERGIHAVGEAGLAYDFLVRSRELPAALDVARRHRDMRFVIDHLAKPPIADGALEPWSTLMEPFGELDNVVAKLSGLVTEADPATWTPDDLRPYVDRALAVFGPRRLAFGSDWPVCLLAASYERVVVTVRELLADLSAAERSEIFGGTARRVYGF
jgi:L-fuconolactonase